MRAILSSASQTVQHFISTNEYVRCILLAFRLPAFEGVVFVLLARDGRPAPLRRAVPFFGGMIRGVGSASMLSRVLALAAVVCRLVRDGSTSSSR